MKSTYAVFVSSALLKIISLKVHPVPSNHYRPFRIEIRTWYGGCSVVVQNLKHASVNLRWINSVIFRIEDCQCLSILNERFSFSLRKKYYSKLTRMHSIRMRTARSSSRMLGGGVRCVCLSACWDTPPPSCGPGPPWPDLITPLRVGLDTPRSDPPTFPLGVGLATPNLPLGVGLDTPLTRPLKLPLECGPRHPPP